LRVLTLLLMGGEEAVAVHNVHGNILSGLADIEKSDVVFISEASGNTSVFPLGTEIKYLGKNKKILTRGHKFRFFLSRRRLEADVGSFLSGYDLVITDGLLTTALIAKQVDKYGLKSLTIVHGEQTKIRPLVSSRIPYLVGGSFYYSCVSGSVKQSLLNNVELPEKRVRAIVSGLDDKLLEMRRFDRAESRVFFGLSSEDFVIGCVARVERHKGIIDLLKAFSKFISKGYKAKLLLIGDGSILKEVDLLSRELGVDASVLLPGYLNYADRYLLAMDVFVLLSKTEGLGLSVLEAQFSGLPVMLSDIPAFREIQKLSVSDSCSVIEGEQDLIARWIALHENPAEECNYDLSWCSVDLMKNSYKSLVSSIMQ